MHNAEHTTTIAKTSANLKLDNLGLPHSSSRIFVSFLGESGGERLVKKGENCCLGLECGA